MKKYQKPILRGCIFGMAVIAALTCLMSLVTSIKDLPQALLDPVAVMILAVGSFTAGFIATRIVREKGFLLGFICGLLMFLAAILVGIGMGWSGFGFLALVKFFALTLAGSVGGIWAVNLKAKRK